MEFSEKCHDQGLVIASEPEDPIWSWRPAGARSRRNKTEAAKNEAEARGFASESDSANNPDEKMANEPAAQFWCTTKRTSSTPLTDGSRFLGQLFNLPLRHCESTWRHVRCRWGVAASLQAANQNKLHRSRDSTVQNVGGLFNMRALISAVVLFSASAPAFDVVVPEPETLALLGVAAAAIILARRKK
jgi:hypothetical protein